MIENFKSFNGNKNKAVVSKFNKYIFVYLKESNKLDKIVSKYQGIEHNKDNYQVGGGLSRGTFASNRHQDAKYDAGKLTLGAVVQIFKKATGLDVNTIREVILYALPTLEWHHAGKLPKSYGGGMKKTYFITATQIVDLASNWDKYYIGYQEAIDIEKNQQQIKKQFELDKLDFLKANAKRVERVKIKPAYFYQTAQEMDGKYGWFDSTHKSYNMPEYYSGWEFNTENDYNKFLKLYMK